MAKHSSDGEPLRSAPGTENDGAGLGEGTDAIEAVLSAERLQVATEQVPSRIARLQKVIVTEQRTITVEVRHEEARLVYEDLPAGGLADDRLSQLPEALPELVLHEEQIQVTTRTVPVERVRAVVGQVTEQRTVSGQVRAERVEVQGADPAGTGDVEG
jgi:uncharacterized protein (TIGR02271 family)